MDLLWPKCYGATTLSSYRYRILDCKSCPIAFLNLYSSNFVKEYFSIVFIQTCKFVNIDCKISLNSLFDFDYLKSQKCRLAGLFYAHQLSTPEINIFNQQLS